LLAQAREAGCSTLVFTVDMPVPGSRYRDYRSGLAGAPGIGGSIRRFSQAVTRPGWAWDVGICGTPHQLGNVAPVLGKNTGLEDFFSWMRNNFDPAVSWRDLDFLRSEWTRPLVIKGILDMEDAKSAVEIGADGIVVSNHGGRQLDGVPSTACALPSIVEAVGDKLAVLLGRVWAYALAGGGEAGVARMLQLVEAEMRVAMALTGVTSLGAVTRDILVQEVRSGRNAVAEGRY
jgi:L-lactate dehydrogenase (cytochrome)